MATSDSEEIKAEKSEDTQIHAKDLEAIRSPHHRAIYANVASSGLSTQDIRVTFGLITDIEARKVGIEEQVTLHMPPAFAHSVAQLILGQLKQWEKLYLPGITTENGDSIVTEAGEKIVAETSEGQQ
jgi:hypothetical protein